MAAQRKKLKVKKPKNSVNLLARDVTAIVSCALCIFLLVSIWFNAGGPAGGALKWLLLGLFGDCAYVIPVFIAAGLVFYIVRRGDEKTVVKLWLISFLPFWLSAAMHFVYRTGNPAVPDGLTGLFEQGQKGGGGVFGGLICEPMLWFLQYIGAFLLLSVVALLLVMLIFEVSVLSLAKKWLKGVHSFFSGLAESLRSDDEESPASQHKPERGEEGHLKPYNWMHDEEEIVLSGNIAGVSGTEKQDAKPELTEDKLEVVLEPPRPQVVEEGNQLKLEQPQEDGEAPAEKKTEYIFPTPSLLDKGSAATGGKVEQLKANAQKLVDILASFGIEAKVTNITRGSSVTRYEVLPAPGVKVSKVTSLDQDIALRLPASNVRIEVLPGSIGIEVSNEKVTSVYLRGLIESEEFKKHPSKLAVALGKDIDGKTVVLDIAKTPHMLIAGATGSGKSVCINTIITSILYKSSPDDVRLVMVDPKVVELGMYDGIPHLLVPIVTDPRKAAGALCWAVQEMENRYKLFSEHNVRDLAGYNRKCAEAGEGALPQIVIIIDELADLMMVAPSEVQDYICRLAQKARAAGMHLVLATQRPSVDVITGIIKANIPTRISFAVSSQVDSRTILDQGGAEKLLGRGDMLLMLQGANKLRRVQGAYISDKDVESVTAYVKQFGGREYSKEVIESIESASSEHPGEKDGEEGFDPLMDSAADLAFELGQISASMLQRRLSIGYARAGRLIDLLERKKVISAYDGTNKPRQVIMSRGDYLEMRSRE